MYHNVGNNLNILSYDNTTYPSDERPGGCVTITIVLVEGTIGDYSAYAGHGTVGFVASQGDKLSFEEACLHFSGLEKEKYRR